MRSSFRSGLAQNPSTHLSTQALALANHLAAAEPMPQVGLTSKRPAGGVSTLSLAHGDADSSVWQSTAASSYQSKYRPLAAPVYVPATASASVGAGGWEPASAASDDECNRGVASRQRGRRSTQPAGGNSSIGSTLASSDASVEPIRGGKGMQNSWDSSAITRRGEICNGGGFAAFSGSNPKQPLAHRDSAGSANSGGKENQLTRDALDAFVSSSSSRPSSHQAHHTVQPAQVHAGLNYGRMLNNSVGGGNDLHGTGRSSSFVSNPPGGRSSISFG